MYRFQPSLEARTMARTTSGRSAMTLSVVSSVLPYAPQPKSASSRLRQEIWIAAQLSPSLVMKPCEAESRSSAKAR
jgi:hypothetical protein